MGFKGYAFDDSVESTGGARKPYCTQGYYLSSAGNVAPSPEDIAEDKNDYFRWDLRLEEGPSNVGRIFPHYTTLAADKQFGLGGMLVALGLGDLIAKLKAHKPVTTYAGHVGLAQILATKAKGRKVGLLIADGQPYRGNPSSDIQEIMTEEEYRERVKLAPNGVVAQPALVGGGAGAITPETVDALLSDLDDI